MLLTTLLLSIELLGVEPKNISLLGMDFAHFSYPEYIKPILFTVFVFVLIGYIQRFFYEGWSKVKAAYQMSVDHYIDKICLKEAIKIQRDEAIRRNDEDYSDLLMEDMLTSTAYSRPTVKQFQRDPLRLVTAMIFLLGDSITKRNKSLVRAITKKDVLWLQLRNILVTGFLRPESYTHIWPLIYASFVVVFYAIPLNW